MIHREVIDQILAEHCPKMGSWRRRWRKSFFSPPHPDRLWTQRASYQIYSLVSFPRVKAAGAWSWQFSSI